MEIVPGETLHGLPKPQETQILETKNAEIRQKVLTTIEVSA